MHTSQVAKDAPFPGEKCARDLQLPNWNVIQECANSTEGSKLLQDYGVQTQELIPTLTSVPTITFNHVSLFEWLLKWPQIYHSLCEIYTQNMRITFAHFLLLSANGLRFDGLWLERHSVSFLPRIT